MFRAAALFALLLAVSAFPSDPSSGTLEPSSGTEISSGLETSGVVEGSSELMIDDGSAIADSDIRAMRDVEGGSGSDETTPTANATCAALAECYGDEECHGGRCLGAFLGTCNCNACTNFWLCSTDGECGGLKSACQNGFCDCYGAYAKNNYTDVLDAWAHLCNVKSCSKDTMAEDCAGLPCNKGFCVC